MSEVHALPNGSTPPPTGNPGSATALADEFFREIVTKITNFLWKGKSSTTRTKYDQLIRKIEDGRLQLVDLKTKNLSLKASWAKRSLSAQQTWAKFAPYFLLGIYKIFGGVT